MSLTASEVAAFKATDKRQNKSCGDSLVLVVEPTSKGGGKSFMGVTRFPPRSPKNGGKRVEVRIGPYGKGVGKWTLKQARDEWDRIRAWSKETGRDPRELKREEKAVPVQESAGPTLEEVCESYCSASTNKTISEYRRLLWGEALPRLGGSLLVSHFGWDHKQQGGRTGRDVVMSYVDAVTKRAPVQGEKVLMVLRQVFNHAIDKGWLERNQNPALNPLAKRKKAPVTPHATLPWDELPTFFKDLERNEANASLVLLASVKVVFMTFLRVGSLAPMRWQEWDEKQNLWRIPAERMKSGVEHLVPLTDPLLEVLEQMRRVNGDGEFVFHSPRSRSLAHINPYSINQHFIRMGYKGVQTAHGLRRTALTAGQDVLGMSAEVIQRQMAHAVGDKVRQTYDDSSLLDERRKFMVAWCDALLERGLKV